jgi:hypothetical protein
MNAEELLQNRRDFIYHHWVKMSYISDEFENHPSREWLNEHCVVKDIASEIPDDIRIVSEREPECIEMFRDFKTAQLNHDTLEYIDIGHVWDFVEWDYELDVEKPCGPYDGFDECLTGAIEYARENDLAILRYTSITSFDNLRYRSLSELD